MTSRHAGSSRKPPWRTTSASERRVKTLREAWPSGAKRSGVIYFDLEEVARFIDVEGTAEDGTISHSVNTIATRERTTRSYTQATQHEFLPCLGEQELMLRQPKARDTAWKRDGRARGIDWRKRAMIRRAGRITPTEEFARRLLVRVLLMRR